MNKQQLIKKIIQKKEFSQLPKKDVELAFSKFDSEDYLDEEKIKLTRELLMKVFSVFASDKLLNIKDKDATWLLKRHSSTRERFDFYPELYERIFKGMGTQGCPPNQVGPWENIQKNIFTKGKFTIFDFGAGMNGLSYEFFPKKLDFDYIGVEAMGQLVDLVNYHFKRSCLGSPKVLNSGRELNGKVYHFSLFELEKIKKYLKQVKGHRSVYPKTQNAGAKIIFLFKTLDSLEMLERNYSKKLLLEIVPLVDRVVVSFATRSLIKKEKFKANKKWLVEFIKENFKITEDFELGGERYISFKDNKLYNR